MSTNKFIFRSISLFLVTLFITSCSTEDPVIPNEEEVITTLKYQLISADKKDTANFVFKGLHGDNAEKPKTTIDTLKKDTEYTGSLTLLNEQESPVENITLEIEEEKDEHQFFFSLDSDVSDLVDIQYSDKDASGKPVGLKTTLTTKGAGAGKLKITLRHKPDKNAADVSKGDITNAGGETDIEVIYEVYIK